MCGSKTRLKYLINPTTPNLGQERPKSWPVLIQCCSRGFIHKYAVKNPHSSAGSKWQCWAREMAQWVQGLDLQTRGPKRGSHRRLDMVTNACNLSAPAPSGRQKRRILASWWSSQSDIRSSKQESRWKGDCCLTSTHLLRHMHPHTGVPRVHTQDFFFLMAVLNWLALASLPKTDGEPTC